MSNSSERHSSEPEPRYDFVIVGGGMVGSALAVGLAQCSLRVALLENHAPAPFDVKQPPDLRVSALNLASQSLLESLGAWDKISKMRLRPYTRLAVWEDAQRCEFDAGEIGREHLGYFVENRLVQLGLHQRAAELNNIDLITGVEISNMTLGSDAHLELTSSSDSSVEIPKSLNFDYLVAADGVLSSTRERIGIAKRGWTYNQQVLAVTVRTTDIAHNTTWQRFSPSGPMAFLPLYDNFAELIWYHDAKKVAQLKSLDKTTLAAEILRCFPKELGGIEVLDCASFPIQRMHASRYTKNNALLMGDAAHSINPLAGQGVNLGFKDVEALLSLLKKNGMPRTLAERRAMARKYECIRRPHNALMMSTMDALYLGFSNNLAPLRKARNLGIQVADRLPFFKTEALRYAAGMY